MPQPRPSSAMSSRRVTVEAEPVRQRPSSAVASRENQRPASPRVQLAPLAKDLSPALPQFPSPFPYTKMPASTTEINTHELAGRYVLEQSTGE
jgi:hypothetical protein